jgi:hypothetical protein
VTRRLVVLLAVLAAASCGKAPKEDPAPARPGKTVAPLIASASANEPMVPATSPAAVPSCTPPLRMTGGELTMRWPALIGRRVQLHMLIERALDFTDVLVTAGGRRLVITMSPDAMWTGVQLHTFVVMGSTTVPLRGRVILPHLLLADEDSCPR